MKSAIPLFFIVAILILLTFYFKLKGPDESYFEEYAFFYNNEINGRLTYVGVKHHAAYFQIENQSAGYIFRPITDNALNNGHVFTNFASINDTIIKEKYSDTLILKKDSGIYMYTFIKAKS